MNDIKHPEIKVQLSGTDGNAFAIMGMVMRELRKAGVSEEEQQQYMAESQSGDYDNLLQTAMRWVDVS